MNLTEAPCTVLLNCEGEASCYTVNLSDTSFLEAKIDCKLKNYIQEFSVFINLVKWFLYYGTCFTVASGVVLNMLSFLVLTRKDRRRSASTLFLSTLAVYDSLTLILNFMIGVIRGQNPKANQSFLDSQSLCKFHGVLVELFNMLSVWTIVAFTVERYIVVKYPLKANMFTSRKILLIIGCFSMSVLVFSCHKVFFTGFEGDSVFGYKGCQTDRLRLPGMVYFYVAFNTWLPTVLITVLNFSIIKEIRSHELKRASMLARHSRTDKKATKLLLTVSFVYLFLVLPLGVVQTVEVFWNVKLNSTPIFHPSYVQLSVTKITLKWIRAFLFFFYQINFAINFFVYVLSSSGQRFRYNLKRLLGIKAVPLTSETMAEQTLARNVVAPLPSLSQCMEESQA